MLSFPINLTSSGVVRTQARFLFTSSKRLHENPLGLPRAGTPPSLPRKGLPQKRDIPHVKKVIVVASGKGGVGKSTLAANLAMALAMHNTRDNRRLRVGLLDLDIFGPSSPKLMGLDKAEEPKLTNSGALIPLQNHGLPVMSMGFLLQKDASGSSDDTPVVWRGLMVQKAIQQLLFDVDWRQRAGPSEEPGLGLDALVLDMPPGTGDVPLTVGQLVNVHGAVIISSPQDVSLSDVRKGIAMFRKVKIPILGLVLNTSYYLCSNCDTRHQLFGSSDSFMRAADDLNISVLGQLPLVPAVNAGGDSGIPFMLTASEHKDDAARDWRNNMTGIASNVWSGLVENP